MSTKAGILGVIAGAALLSVVAGCTSPPDNANDPKARLNDYISKSFSIRDVSERAGLEGFLTGDAKIRLAAWSDDQFKSAFINSKRDFIRLAFAEVKPISAEESAITYELVYNENHGTHQAKVTNKKVAQLVLVNGKWMVKDVRNIKELIEYNNELTF